MEHQYIETKEIYEVIDIEHVDIFSKNAIRGFSIFPTIFSGILLYQNLMAVNYKKIANTVLIFSICYSIASFCIAILIFSSGVTYIIANVLGGFILSDYFFPKYFPDEDYYPKSIWKALAISLIVCGIIILSLYYLGFRPELGSEVAAN